jgi:sporulation protein YlmC with PRC-barrel domain
MRHTATTLGVIAVLAAGSTAATAQTNNEGYFQGEDDVVEITTWAYDALYADGWRADWALGTDVYGPTGDEIGELEDIVIGPDGNVLSIVAEVGGFWDIGDSHINVPWDEVEVTGDFDRVQIPVTEENVEQYSGYEARLTATEATAEVTLVDDVAAGERAWRVRELIGDYAYLEDRVGYGYVDDLIFSNGQLESVVIRPDVGYGTAGYYAYPYYGYEYGWHPGFDYYQLPYTEEEAAELEPFEYDELEG